MRGTSLGKVSSLQHLLYLRWASHPSPPDHTSGKKAQKSRVLPSKGGGDRDSSAARLSWKGRLIPESAPAAAQCWGRGFPAGSHLPQATPSSALPPPRPAPGMEVPPFPMAEKVQGLLSSLKTNTVFLLLDTFCSLVQAKVWPRDLARSQQLPQLTGRQPTASVYHQVCSPGIWGRRGPEALMKQSEEPLLRAALVTGCSHTSGT